MGRLMAELQTHQDKYRALISAKAMIAKRIEENSQLARTLTVKQQLGETVPANVMSNKQAAELQEPNAKQTCELNKRQKRRRLALWQQLPRKLRRLKRTMAMSLATRRRRRAWSPETETCRLRSWSATSSTTR